MSKCKDCKKAGTPWQRRQIGSGGTIMTLHFCPVLNDDVHENYGGCHEFTPKTTKPTLKIQQKPRQYFESVLAMRMTKEKIHDE